MASLKLVAMILGCLWMLTGGCTADRSKRIASGPYQTWNDVIERWIGGKTTDLYLELGPPNLHPHELENGMTEMVVGLCGRPHARSGRRIPPAASYT